MGVGTEVGVGFDSTFRIRSVIIDVCIEMRNADMEYSRINMFTGAILLPHDPD